jgi:lysophospholipase L1-like esterase
MTNDEERAAIARGEELARQAMRPRASRAGVSVMQTGSDKLEGLTGLIEPSTVDRVEPGSAGVLVAEGDSWFDYPFHDVVKMLEDEHGFDVESVARRGDRVEDMAYGGGQLDALVRVLRKLLRRDTVPRAILLSGGGNDIAGDELAMLLNHRQSSCPGLNEHVMTGIIDVRLRLAYLTLIAEVTAVCRDHGATDVPIIVHGYGYSIPDGRGFWGGWGPLPGPWLKPSFARKGFDNQTQNVAFVRQLIDRFNAMIESIAKRPEWTPVRYVDLRPVLNGSLTDYSEHWENELHPNEAGFRLVAAQIASAIG